MLLAVRRGSIFRLEPLTTKDGDVFVMLPNVVPRSQPLPQPQSAGGWCSRTTLLRSFVSELLQTRLRGLCESARAGPMRGTAGAE